MELKEITWDGKTRSVSKCGKVFRRKDDGFLFEYKQTVLPDGYVHAGGGAVHMWVAIAYLGHEPDGHRLVVNHKDGNRSNNTLENLEIVSQSENIFKSVKEKTSLYPFVTYCQSTNRYKVSMKAEGKHRYYGSFLNEDDAGKVSRVLCEIYKPEILKYF